MKVEFTKMNGLGNDFVFVEDMEMAWDPAPGQVEAICDRHFGVGGDGLILVRPSAEPGCDAYMHYFNADGSLAEMCGNGVRCFAKYLVDHGMVDAAAGSLVAGTLAGPRPIRFEVDGAGRMTVATVDMGAPVLAPAGVPTSLPANAAAPDGTPYVREAALDSPWGPFAFTCVGMGNPHAVCFLDDMASLPDALFKGPGKSLPALDVDSVGGFFEGHAAFPAKANVEFAVASGALLEMRVYERGDGETLACGTGACATAVAAALTGRAGRGSDVRLPGGILRIDWGDDGHVRMTGPAAESFTGSLELPDS